MEMMSNQEAFNIAAKGLLSQMCRSMREGDEGDVCAYRGKDGLKCGIGFLVSDELGSLMDKAGSFGKIDGGTGVISWLHHFKVNGIDNPLTNLNHEMLISIQQCHDCDPPSEWEKELKWIADKYGLEWQI